jgi:hypothetical protein
MPLRFRRRLACAALVGVLAVSEAAVADDFRLLALPQSVYGRMADRERQPLPASERERVVARASADFSGAAYYNRPGADWDDYVRDWYGCEVETDGSRIPGGQVKYLKSPTLLSPRRSGIGIAIGGAIGVGEDLDALHEANRKACMRVRGWRRVTNDEAEARRIDALSDPAFKAWVAGAIGSQHPQGRMESAASARLPENAAIRPDAPPAGEPTLRISGGGDPTSPLALRPREGALVLAFRRPDRGSAGQHAAIVLRRYDLARADLARGEGDQALSTTIVSTDRQAGYELRIVRLPAAYYVIDGTSVDGKPPAKSNCFGAPLLEVPAGQAVYAGDWVPYHEVKLPGGKILPDALVLVSHLDQARAALARFQPALAGNLRPMAVANGASYACTDPNVVLDAWTLANVPEQPGR